jgi:hypothetical protein
MNAEIFAEWLGRQGLPVTRTASSYWHLQGPRAYQAFPYHWLIEPVEGELEGLLRSQGALGLRYSAPLHASEGALSYHAVYEAPRYDFESLGAWSRKNVRRGLRNCVVEPVTFGRLSVDGWALQLDTLDRQHRRLRVTEAAWRCRCLAAAELPGFEAWGALVDGVLAASVISLRVDDWCYLLYQQCHRRYLPLHINNALSFVVTRAALAQPGIRAVLYAVHSLDAPPSVDEFKFRMGYVAKPVRQRVVFHPWLRPFVGPPAQGLLTWCRRYLPGHATLAKAEGFARCHRNGSLPLDRQPLPAGLRRDAIGVEAGT